jgi:archaeal cell division control protein 6
MAIHEATSHNLERKRFLRKGTNSSPHRARGARDGFRSASNMGPTGGSGPTSLVNDHGTVLKQQQRVNDVSAKLRQEVRADETQDEQHMEKIQSTNLFLQTIQERELRKGKIFRNENRDLLRSDYIPEELPHREKELQQIVSILSTAMHGGQPSNIFVYGTTGTGKTAVVLNVKRQVKEIESIMIEQGLRPMRMLYVNCRLNDTKYTLLSKIGNELSHEGENIPSGWPTDRVYQQLLRNIDRMGSTIVLVLDEVNALVEKSGDEALYLLSRINSDLGQSRLTIISITNNPQMWNILNPSVRSTLTPEDVYFEAYNAQHLRDILEDRARSCFVDGSLDDGVISRCAAIAAQEHGDARIALELLRKSGEIAERIGSAKVNNDHVMIAHKAIETSKTTGVIRGLSFHSKAVLLAVYAHARKGFRKVSTGEVYDIYGKICDLLLKPPLTQRRVSDLISELDMLGIARSLVISKGRYGRTKEINLAASLEDVREALHDDEDFSDLMNIDVNQRMI